LLTYSAATVDAHSALILVMLSVCAVEVVTISASYGALTVLPVDKSNS